MDNVQPKKGHYVQVGVVVNFVAEVINASLIVNN